MNIIPGKVHNTAFSEPLARVAFLFPIYESRPRAVKVDVKNREFAELTKLREESYKE